MYKSKIFLFLFCCLFTSALPGPAAQAGGPLSALTLAQNGIDQCDSDLFNKAVDVGEVTDHAADALLAALLKASSEGRLDASAGMVISLVKMAKDSGQDKFIKQLLLSEIKSFLASGINGGWFAGKADEKTQSPGSGFAAYLKKLPRGRRTILPGKVLSESGDQAEVSATFTDPQAGAFPLVLGLKRQDGVWRVMEIKNAMELFTQAATKKI
ncbi:MAG: hypothetical protein LBN33_10385 [Desulfovibrio sp.]|jgi:hypothetical protein|nr:hypothetical protein [Desulfovibrio sp.]